jgi:hypothetical protein
MVSEKKEEVMKKKKLPLLIAHRDRTLSVEAAEQLVRMSEDQSLPVHEGRDLPTANRAALLKKAARKKKADRLQRR